MLKATLAVVVALIACAFCASAAQADPQLELSAGGPPKVLVPGQSESGTLTFSNTGDAQVATGAATVTLELDEGLTPTAVSASLWQSCTIDAVANTVTCVGPITNHTIPAGANTCSLFGFLFPACPITVTFKAADDAAKGSYDTTIEACVTGFACTTTVKTTVIQDYGDNFGFAPIGPDDAGAVPAIDSDKAFWAGSCDRAGAPAFGVDLAPLGGLGSIPSTVWAPAAESGPQSSWRTQVPAPSTTGHCIDLGEPTFYPQAGSIYEPGLGIWFEEPDWRLPPGEVAGSHPDGSTTMALKRDANMLVDGAVDNIAVDLPPGFIGNPNAVDKCTQDEFADEPPQCSPASQVGTIQMLIQGRGFGHAGHGPGGNYKIYPIWNLEPREGRIAEFGFAYASGEDAVSVRLTGKARTSGDFGVTAFTGQIPAALTPVVQTVTIWGVPWEQANDVWRAPKGLGFDVFTPTPCSQQAGTYTPYIPYSGFMTPGCPQSYDPSWGDIQPFVSQETDCATDSVVKGWTDAYQNPGDFVSDGSPNAGKLGFLSGDPDPADSEFDGGAADPGWKTATSDQAAVTGCENVGFEPDIEFGTSTSAADGATGLVVDLSVPQNNVPPFDPPVVGAPQGEVDDYVDQAAAHWKSTAGLATAHLKDSVVALPSGVSVNPSAATGLVACDDATVGVSAQGNPPLFDNSDPTDGMHGDDCPDGSRIGTARVDTPLLDEPLTGDVILGTPKSTNPQSGEMFRMFLVLRDKDRGLIAKVYGSAVTDPATGRITATFENNPEVPFESLHLEFKGGSKGLLAMPQRCGAPAWSASFTPWSSVGAPVAVPDAPDGGVFAVDQGCANGFSPGLAAGMDTPAARSNGTFSFRFGRSEGDQYLRGLTATLPKGLLASVKDVPLCSNAAANAGACPAGSKIGIVDAKAGSGDPFVLEEKGEVFLTDGYKGGEYGLAVKIRPVAGPFRGALELSPIIVRQAIHVDRKTAQVTATSDPFPLIHHGVPLRAREVTVLVNRGNFMLNPSDCAAKQVGADLVSDQGANANLTNGFQAAGCSNLAFKPKLALRLTGRKQVRTGKHPGIRAVVTQKGVPEAGIEKAEVRLPKSLALDVDNAQALCEFEDGTKPDLENHCPKGSIVGRARAVSPLLNDSLVGNVYFVKNVRRSSSGNLIRTLPMIVVALRGEIAVNLVGESNVSKGRLVNTFDEVPDAPITRFNLNINGGKNGIIAVTRTRRSLINLCSGRHVAEADMDGHNGRRYDRDIRMKTPCTKKQTKAAKRKAKRAAAKRAAVRRAVRQR